MDDVIKCSNSIVCSENILCGQRDHHHSFYVYNVIGSMTYVEIDPMK